MWKVKVNDEIVFQDECQQKCMSHAAIKDYYQEDGYDLKMVTDRENLEIKITKTYKE